MKTLILLLLFLISCQNEPAVRHSYLQDFEVVDKIYHYDHSGFEYRIRDSFGKTFTYHSTQHFAVGDKIELTLK